MVVVLTKLEVDRLDTSREKTSDNGITFFDHSNLGIQDGHLKVQRVLSHSYGVGYFSRVNFLV